MQEPGNDYRPGSAFSQKSAEHLPWLDGLRGLAALWVLASHVQILSGMHAIPGLSWGGLAVDLFMLLSGFLMAHHYVLRREQEPWEERSTFIIFWLRRFFRIAPLYYVLLVIALGLGPWLGEARDMVAQVWSATASPPVRYHDQSALNFLVHFSFIFGMVPEYSFRTPLPDWSIGLEMSFYLAFPFLMLMMLRLGPILAGMVAILISGALLYGFADFFARFEMPSFLPFKLYLFVIGMWIAISRLQGSMRFALVASLGVLAAVCLLERSDQSVGRIFLALGMFYLMDNGSLPAGKRLLGAITAVRAAFSSALAKFLGNTSYGVYLVHLLLVLPIAALLTRFPGYLAAPDSLRYLLCLALVIPPVYLIAWGLFRTVETAGIQLGKATIQQLRRKSRLCRPVET